MCVCSVLQDLAENGVEIELMHIGSSFDVSLFYQVQFRRLILHTYVQSQYYKMFTVSGGCMMHVSWYKLAVTS